MTIKLFIIRNTAMWKHEKKKKKSAVQICHVTLLTLSCLSDSHYRYYVLFAVKTPHFIAIFADYLSRAQTPCTKRMMMILLKSSIDYPS